MKKQISILLVDDEPRNLQVLTAILESPDYDLVKATSADEALLALMSKDFAAIVLDVRMPNLDGIELAHLIKQRKKTQHIPIVFLTAYEQEEEQIVIGYGAGAVDYITKPVNPAILRSKIGVLIELFKKSTALAEANFALITEIGERQKAEEALRKANTELATKNAELLQQADDRARRIRAEAAQAEAEAANRAKDNFLAMLSHELRTPLSPVLHAVSLLEEETGCTPAMREVISTIRRNVQLEARLIDDLLDLSKIRNAKLQLHLEPVDVHDLLHRTLEICKTDISTNRLRVTLNLNARETQLKADPARIQQIFWNLITNAIKYTSTGGHLTLTTSNEGEMFQFQISDSGIGIETGRITRIFDAFEQVHENRSSGLGLGLAICRALIELHGGSIEAHSEGKDRGATFVVKLPVGVELPMSPKRDYPVETGAIRLPLKLLLVEDHADTTSTLARLLRRRGYELQTATNVTEALRLSSDYEFDVLVSDIGLPDGSGLDLMRELTRQSNNRPVHGIALSGFGMQQDLDRSRDAGFFRHFTKPVDISQLHSALIELAEEHIWQKNGATVSQDA